MTLPLFPFRQKDDIRMKYDIDLYDDNTYNVVLTSMIPSGWMESTVERLRKLKGLTIPLEEVDSFLVDDRYLGIVQMRIKKTLKEIEDQVREDLKDFKILSGEVKAVLIEKEETTWRVIIHVRGLYTA